jgi:hypothetical protein
LQLGVVAPRCSHHPNQDCKHRVRTRLASLVVQSHYLVFNCPPSLAAVLPLRLSEINSLSSKCSNKVRLHSREALAADRQTDPTTQIQKRLIAKDAASISEKSSRSNNLHKPHIVVTDQRKDAATTILLIQE